MRHPLSQSGFLWTFLLLWISFCFVDGVGATGDRSRMFDNDAPSVAAKAAVLGISLLDVWAGISSFFDGFSSQAHVPVLESAWVENAHAATALLAATYAGAKCCKDFYSYSWTGWKFSHDLVITGGPSCCPFSISGKRRRQHDGRSSQGMDTAAMAVHLGATVLIIENVSLFLKEDYLHHLVSEMDDYLLSHGFVRSGSWMLTDSALGGSSGRERVFLVWEKADMASLLPSWPQPPAAQCPSALLTHLEAVDSVGHLAVRGQSELVLDGSWPHDPLQALRIGSIWLRGPERCWMLGEALKLRGDHRVWRIIETTKWKLRLIFDSRSQPAFMWITKERVSFSQRHWIEWPVHSIHGVARAIRHTAFAPGDLYLDDRSCHSIVRPLSGEEKWRVMELSQKKASKLNDLGLCEEKSPLAGNSITGRMAATVAEAVGQRIAVFQRRRAAFSEGKHVLMEPSVSIKLAQLSAVFLVVLHLGQEAVVSWSNSTIPGMVANINQDQAFSTACRWAQDLGYTDAQSKCILLERRSGPSHSRAVIYYGVELGAAQGASLIKIADVLNTPLGELAVAALAQVQRMAGSVTVNHLSSDGWQSGRVAGTAAHQEQEETAASRVDLDAFEEIVRDHNAAADVLKALLNQSQDKAISEWAQNLLPLSTEEVPTSLMKPLGKLEWSQLQLPNPHTPIETKWQSLPAKVELPRRAAPQGWLTAVRQKHRAEAARRARAFAKKMTQWLAGLSERPQVVVIPGSWLEHWVYEAPHDFHSQPGIAIPIDMSKASPSHLNLDFYLQQAQKYPDQELLSFLILGVRYKADIPIQIVLQPHLQSFLPVQDKYLQESDRFLERGWSICSESIPVVPYFCAACGSVCRPLEPDRPRCTNDAGAPRKSVIDEDGVRVVPINEAIAQNEWPKEVKPSALDVVIAMRVLLEAAQVLGEKVFCICDDFKSFFNQLRLSPSEYCKTGVVHPPRVGQSSVSFSYDKVLGFGLKMASNIAQRFADLLVHIFRKAVAPAVKAAAKELSVSNLSFQKWWLQRLSLGDFHASLVVMLMYCDDPIILCVGADMTHEALKVWTWMAAQGGTMMAIPEKRSLGLSAKWIGIRFFVSLGISAATAQKVLRAFSSIDQACCGSMTLDQYRSLIGFLEHLRAVLFLRGDKMYGLYEPLNCGLEPIERVKCTSLAALQLNRFKHRLTVQAGSTVQHVQAFLSGKPLPKVQHSVAARRWAIFSDAAKEGTDEPGLGGWIVGHVWRVALTHEDLILHISLLEAIAAVVNVVCAHRLMGGTDHLPPDTCIEAHIDAQATAQVLIRGKARSPALVFLHQAALQIPEFREMLPFLLVLHVFGLGNIASDAASRGYHNVLQVVAISAGVRLIHLPEPVLARKLLDKCLMWRCRMLHEHCWGDDAILYGEAENPGPTFNCIKRCPQVPTEQLQEETAPAVKHASFNQIRRQQMTINCSSTAVLPKAICQKESSCTQRPVVSNLSVQNLASMLWADLSPHAICRGNYEQLLTACAVALDTAAEAFSLRTAKQDIGHWDAWSGYCKHMNTDPMRPSIDPQLNRVAYLREVVLLINALVHFMKDKKTKKQR